MSFCIIIRSLFRLKPTNFIQDGIIRHGFPMLPRGHLLHGNAERGGKLRLREPEFLSLRQNLLRRERLRDVVEVMIDAPTRGAPCFSRFFHGRKL